MLAVKSIVVDRMSIARVAANLGVAWNTASDAILTAGTELLIDSAGRLDGVTTVGVDEHVWRHTRHGDKYVTVIIDLTPTRTRTGPSRLLAVVEGRSKQAFKSWLEAQTKAFRDRVEVVAMDGFTGYKTAAVEAIDTVVTVMDPFHVVALVGDKLDRCRQRVQQETLGHRGRSGDPLYGIRRVARTRAGLLTEKQQHRLAKVFADERHVAFEVTWSVYQNVIDAYQAEQPAEGKKIMTRLISSLQSGVPTGLDELRSLGQTMKRRRDDILAFFDHPGTSNAASNSTSRGTCPPRVSTPTRPPSRPSLATWRSFMIVDRSTPAASAAWLIVVSPRTSWRKISYFTDGANNFFARRVGVAGEDPASLFVEDIDTHSRVSRTPTVWSDSNPEMRHDP